MVGRRWNVLLGVLLIALLVGSVGAVAEITFEKDGSAQINWWFVGEHPEIAGLTGDHLVPFCVESYGNHWSVEIGTHSAGDWAYVALNAGERMLVGDITRIGFQYVEIQTRGPSLAVALMHDTEGPLLAVMLEQTAAGLGPHVVGGFVGDPGLQTWDIGTWDGEDPTTFVASSTGLADFSAVQTRLPIDFPAAPPAPGNISVVAVLVVVTDVLTPTTTTATCAVDHIELEWLGTHGGEYNLEPAWPFHVADGLDVPGPYTFDDWPAAPLPDPNEPPRQFAHWCKDDIYCAHCQPVDDENLWDIVKESNFAGLPIPQGIVPFESSEHAIWFGRIDVMKGTATYDVDEVAVGAICSPLNQVNPADRYVTISFDHFREVEQYQGPKGYDWTYVQIQFLDDQGEPAWPAHNSTLTGWFDPFDYDPNGICLPSTTAPTHYVNGDVEPHPDLYNRSPNGCIDTTLYDPGCFPSPLPTNPALRAAALANTGWKTVWYKDSRDPNSTAWENVEITHYLKTNNQPYEDSAHRIVIPPNATQMRIRFVFNSVDGAGNDYFGWIIDNVEKQHGYESPGCSMCIDSLPQAAVGEKYDVSLCPTGGGVRWKLVSVFKDGQRMVGLPGRLALDTSGRIFGTPDVGTTGTYEVKLELTCSQPGTRPVDKTFVLNIRPSHSTPPQSQIGIEHFHTTLPNGRWINGGTGLALPAATVLGCGDENLWHQTTNIAYILDTADLKADYGAVAFFGVMDNGIPADDHDPNFCGVRVKGCMYNPYGDYIVTSDEHVGQELTIGFKSWRNVEYYPNGEFDKTWVTVKINNGPTHIIWAKSAKDVSPAQWRWEEVNTGIILKKSDKITVSFCFDSVDGFNNGQDGNAWGWAVDEVTLFAGSADLTIVSCPKDTTSVNEYYNEEVRASGGPSGNVEWSVTNGTLPPGLQIQPDNTNTRIAKITGMARDAGTFTFTLVAEIRNQVMATRTCTITVGREVTLLWEDFEDDPYWSGTGLWRFTGTHQPANRDPVTQVVGINNGIKTGDLGDENHAAYYGRQNEANYDTGATTSGMMTLALQPIDLANGPQGSVEAFRVTFDQWRHVESFGGTFDRTLVQVQFDEGAWQTIWFRDATNTSPMKEWTTEQVGPFPTNGASTMLIRFVFDSVDKWYNNFTGWLVDNVRVESAMLPSNGGMSFLSLTDRVDPRGAPAELQVMNVPNPVTDVNTTTFMVRSAGVDAMKIEIYDLSGALVFSEEVAGNELVWHTDNDFGEYLANGIYLYHAYVRIQGEWIKTSVQKLVILR